MPLRPGQCEIEMGGEVKRSDELQEIELVDAPADVLIGLVRELTLEAWAMRAEPLPSYPCAVRIASARPSSRHSLNIWLAC